MRSIAILFFSCTCSSLLALHPLLEELKVEERAHFSPFTGKVARKKVRMRTSPHLEGPIVREAFKGELFVADGQVDGFYQVRPPADVKGYLFRTFVLDGQVEGTRVNVRLAPDLDAPVIAQLNTGDRVEGVVSQDNGKWLEISLPETVRFYIAEDYMEQVGDASYLAQYEKRKDEATRLLNQAIVLQQKQTSTPFEQMQTDPILELCRRIQRDYADYEDHVARAALLEAEVNDTYITKKIHHLEAKAQEAELLARQVKRQKALQQEIVKVSEEAPSSRSLETKRFGNTHWDLQEENLFAVWSLEKELSSLEEFYLDETKKGQTIHGVIEPYLRPVKNKPGDFMIVHPKDHRPMAYLYSTRVDLQEKVGKEVDLVVAPRPNNQFAYPAYYVLEVR